MRKFMEMCEAIAHDGLINFKSQEFQKRIFEIIGDKDRGKYVEDFSTYAEQARTFVFTTLPQRSPEIEGILPRDGEIHDLPFPIISIEVASGPLGLYRETYKGHEATDVWVQSILIVEYAPKRIGCYMLCEWQDKRGVILDFSPRSASLCQIYIDRINTEKMGLEKVRQRVSLGSGTTKRRHTIREVIHISPQVPTAIPSGQTREIDWTHRFEVRGHWRVTEGIGKDRQGNYVVEGHTWVKEHIRGPGSLPLIKKQRVVHTPS